eukprot:18164-Pelagococcus_subviridis.AAC.2
MSFGSHAVRIAETRRAPAAAAATSARSDAAASAAAEMDDFSPHVATHRASRKCFSRRVASRRRVSVYRNASISDVNAARRSAAQRRVNAPTEIFRFVSAAIRARSASTVGRSTSSRSRCSVTHSSRAFSVSRRDARSSFESRSVAAAAAAVASRKTWSASRVSLKSPSRARKSSRNPGTLSASAVSRSIARSLDVTTPTSRRRSFSRSSRCFVAAAVSFRAVL